ncbi:MAG: carbonic anhydrase [Bacteroidetes bacterium]|nr:carbonic anhydrase [Bacteroidota bacterium]MDA0904008.1 carbonic anhydrase [Bacteroidota bacterium]MDA1243002.1 carbonic anhydrase [Bacteroidota bacterium]
MISPSFSDVSGTVTKDVQTALGAKEAFAWLVEGHERFKNQNPRSRDRQSMLEGAAQGQFPYAAVLGCIDSRAPIEQVFDAQIGDLFVARVAGNVVNEDVLGSLEYACKYAGTKVIVVLGHTSCGAVGAAWNGVEDGNITSLLAKIKPAVETVQRDRGTEGSAENLNACVAENVSVMCQTLREQSDILAGLEDEGSIIIAGGVYNVATGEVQFTSQP